MPDGAVPAMRIPSYIVPATIIESVAGTMGTTVVDLLGKRLLPNLHASRQICCLLFSEFTLLSMVEMGVALGRPNPGGGWRLLTLARTRLDDDKRFYGAFEQARQGLLQRFQHV